VSSSSGRSRSRTGGEGVGLPGGAAERTVDDLMARMMDLHAKCKTSAATEADRLHLKELATEFEALAAESIPRRPPRARRASRRYVCLGAPVHYVSVLACLRSACGHQEHQRGPTRGGGWGWDTSRGGR
jgi:hypothetical protein